MREYPPIPEPMLSIPSHQDVLVVLKEAVELLTRQRGDQQNSAAMMKEILVKLEDAPHDGYPYYRRNGVWVRVPPRIFSAEYSFNLTTTAPPGHAQVRMDNADQTLATKLWLDNETSAAVNVMLVLEKLYSGTKISIQDMDDPTKYQNYIMIADAINAGGVYAELPVAWGNGGVALTAQRVEIVIVDEGKV